jgi:hypothetical protein
MLDPLAPTWLIAYPDDVELTDEHSRLLAGMRATMFAG